MKNADGAKTVRIKKNGIVATVSETHFKALQNAGKGWKVAKAEKPTDDDKGKK